MKWILLAVYLIFSGGCGIYSSVDARLFPAPEIQKEATVTLWRQGTDMTTELKSWVNHTDIALLYYACAESSEWKIDNIVYDVYPIDGLIRHKRQTACYSKLRIWMIAYNNFQKRTQKSAQMIWIVDMEKLIARHAAKGVRI